MCVCVHVYKYLGIACILRTHHLIKIYAQVAKNSIFTYSGMCVHTFICVCST